MCVEGRKGLVEEEDGGVSSQRARQRHTLALSSGQLVHPSAGQVVDPEALEELVDARIAPNTETHVPEDAEMREECVLLEQISDAPMLRSEIDPSFRIEEYRLAETNGSRLRAKQTRDHAKDCRLPGARRPNERKRLAAGDCQLG